MSVTTSTTTSVQTISDKLTVRSYKPGDQSAIEDLYVNGLLAGQIAENDTGADIDNIAQAYIDEPRHHFWVAQLDDKIVGMIAVGSDEQHTAEVRRLRVDSDHRNSEIAAILLKAAVDHCKKNGYLKVRLDTRFQEDAAVDMFHKVGFEHTRTKSVKGKDLLEFYLDIYRQPEEDKNH